MWRQIQNHIFSAPVGRLPVSTVLAVEVSVDGMVMSVTKKDTARAM